MIGVILRNNQEYLNLIKKSFKDVFAHSINNIKFYVVKTFSDQTAVIGLTGYGKANAAMISSLMINNFNIDVCLNIGVAQPLKAIDEFELLVADQTSYCDVDATSLGFELNQIPNQKTRLSCDQSVNDEIIKIINFAELKYKLGLIYTSDSYIDAEKSVNLNETNLSCCWDNEACSINQVCNELKIKFSSIKLIIKDLNNYNDAKNIETINLLTTNLIDAITYYLESKKENTND